MKKITYAVFALVLAFGAAACSADSTPGTTAADSAAAPDSATPAEARPTASAPAAPAAPRMFTIPEGTELTIVLTDSISTATNSAGDEFAAVLGEPVTVNGQTVVEKGVKVRGRVVDAEGSGRVSGRASIRMVLTSIGEGSKSHSIATKPFAVEAEATKGRDAGIIGTGAGIGAAIGAIAGGKSGAAKGAVIGGAAGTGTVLATKGKEVEFSSESRLKFALEKAVSLPRIVS